MLKLTQERGSVVRPAFIFAALLLVYYCWMTGLTFKFSETSVFPTYNMLAASFLKGQLNIDENPPVDYLTYNGKKYLYFGPGPAIFHMPSLILAGRPTPTGLIVIILVAGAVAIFHAILGLWQHSDRPLGVERSLFSIVFAFNGYSLLMATIPSIHHEAICSGMFFLLAGLYYVLKSMKNGFELSLSEALVSGTCFCFCLLSRFSYVFTVIVLVFVVTAGRLRNSAGLSARSLFPVAVLAFVASTGIVAALGYNYLRFGSLGDFGVGYMQTLYREYFLHGNYLRYDHIPYNLWDYFFRIPQMLPDFPYLGLPFHILEIKSLRSPDFFLMHVNELSVSVFVLMPVLLFCFFCNIREQSVGTEIDRSFSRVLSASIVLQVVPLSLTIGSIVRYYFDFLPLMLIMAFGGYMRIRGRLSHKYLTLGLTSAVSLLFSFFLSIGAMFFYWNFINYRSPLLGP
ncbi:MAG: hypothetical protein HY912_19650 [Desulfomonile tiedjei]|uniref:Uncharacterized protein n=1 Tax=Desulfomonile tiedjei TaxID=2358 RepID=A0A9D6Z224_9BACT|nr:hypothetical protein [Desulfomonile tiedjei]